MKKDIINYKPAMDELLTFLTEVRRHPEALSQYKLALSYAAYLFDYDKLDWAIGLSPSAAAAQVRRPTCNLRVGNKKALRHHEGLCLLPIG